MDKAIILLCKALATAIEARYRVYDHETSSVLVALSDFVNSKQTKEQP